MHTHMSVYVCVCEYVYACMCFLLELQYPCDLVGEWIFCGGGREHPMLEMLLLALLYLPTDFALQCSHVFCCASFCWDNIRPHPEWERAVSASWLVISV